MTQAKLELRGLSKNFDDVTAVDAVNLTVETGESVVLLGPSGCGKTTTLRLVAGFVRPNGGEIFIDGEQVASAMETLPTEKRGIGMVFQNYAVWPHKTVDANIAFGLRIKGLPRRDVTALTAKALSLVKMDGLGGRYPSELSGGQQQRVALARALVVEPTLLLLDEPLSNLDASLREEMRFEIRDLQRRLNLTMLYVTHDQQEAMVVADRVVVMNSGRMDQAAPPEDIYRRPRTRFVASFVGQANLIEGRVEKMSDGRATIRTGMDRTGVVALPGGATPLPEGAALEVGREVGLIVRPEDVTVGGPGGDGVNEFSGSVLRRVFLGTSYDMTVKIGDVELRCQAPKNASPADNTVNVHIPAEAWWILEE